MSFPPKNKKPVNDNVSIDDALKQSLNINTSQNGNGNGTQQTTQQPEIKSTNGISIDDALKQSLNVKKKEVGGNELNSTTQLPSQNINGSQQSENTPETNVDVVNPPKAQVTSIPDFNIINRKGEFLLSTPGDPLGTAINNLQTQRQSIINKNIGADATAIKTNHKIIDLNGRPVSVTNGSDEVNNLDSQIQQIKQKTFSNPQVADDYLKQKLNGKQVALKANNQDALGLGHEVATVTPNSDLSLFDTKSLQENLDKTNVTDQLAFNRVKQQQNLTDALTSSQNLNEAALKYSANESPVIQKQIDALQKTGNKLPDAYEGQLIANFLNNPDVIQRAQSNPALMQQYKQTASSLYTQYPEYAKRVVAQKISQAREDAGLNNPIVNVPTQASTDKVVDDMYKAGTLNDAEKAVYENSIRPSIGVLQSIGRGIGRLIPGVQANVEESPIVTPGFFENTENSYVNTLHGMAHSLEDVAKVTPIGHVLPLPTDSDRLKQSLQNDYSTITINPKGAWNSLGQGTGNMTGFVLPMIMGGTATNAIGAGANASELITNGLIFEGQNRDNALKSFPDNPAKQFMYTTLATAGDMMIGKLIPSGEAKQGVNNLLKNDIKDVVNNFVDGTITEAAARKTILEKATDVAGKVVKGNLHTGTAMAGFGLLHNGLDAAFGSRDVSLGDAANEAIQNFKAGFLGGTVVSAMAAFGGDQKLNGDVLLEMATNPEYYTKVINDQAKLNTELEATKSERIRNLNEAALINKDLQSTDLDNNKKGQYLIQALNQNIWERKAEGATNEVLKNDYIKKANESKKIQQDILAGKEIISSQSNTNQNGESKKGNAQEGSQENVQSENGRQQNGQESRQENDVLKNKGAATVNETAPLAISKEDNQFIKESFDNNLIPSIDKGMLSKEDGSFDESKVPEYLKSVAEQAQGGGNEETMLKQGIPKEVIDLAKEKYPAPKESVANTTVSPTKTEGQGIGSGIEGKDVVDEISSFADKINKGWEMKSDEDFSFYDKNKKAIEAKLKELNPLQNKITLSDKFANPDNAINAIEEIKKLGKPNELNENQVVINGVKVDIQRDGSKIWLKEISALDQGKGEGTKVLNKIKEIANSHEADIILHPTQIKNTSEADLIKWYKKNGFEDYTQGRLIYRSKSNEVQNKPTTNLVPMTESNSSLEEIGDVGTSKKSSIVDNKQSENKGIGSSIENEKHRDDIMNMLVDMKDSSFDYRITSDISQKEREKGVADLRNGIDSAAARKVKGLVDEMINSGELPIHRGSGGKTEKFNIPFKDWFGEVDKAEKELSSYNEEQFIKDKEITQSDEYINHLIDQYEPENSTKNNEPSATSKEGGVKEIGNPESSKQKTSGTSTAESANAEIKPETKKVFTNIEKLNDKVDNSTSETVRDKAKEKLDNAINDLSPQHKFIEDNYEKIAKQLKKDGILKADCL